MKYTEKDIFEGAIISTDDGKYEYLVTDIQDGKCKLTGLVGETGVYPGYHIVHVVDMANSGELGSSFIKNKPEIYEIY